MARLRDRKGLTLIELMIVVIIIGVLIAVAFPNFIKAREIARLRTCANNMKHIMMAIEMWAIDNKMPGDTPREDLPTPAELADQGYLKVEPLCPEGGQYTYTGSNLNAYDVSCDIHGNLQDIIGNL